MTSATSQKTEAELSKEPLLIAGQISVELKQNHTDESAVKFNANINPSMSMVGAKLSVYKFADGNEWLVINCRPYASFDHQGAGQVFACSLSDVAEIREGRNGENRLALEEIPRIDRPGTLEAATAALWAV